MIMNIDLDKAVEELKKKLPDYVEQITEKARVDGYICPLCKSGTGKNGTGAFKLYENNTKFKCFRCLEAGDIFDLVGKEEGISDYVEQVKRIATIFSYRLNYEDSSRPKLKKKEAPAKTEPTKPKKDYTSFFEEAHSNIANTDYPERRGLSSETINRFKIGYIEKWKAENAPENVPASPRLIIPTSKYSYIARDTRAKEAINDTEKNFCKMKAGKVHIFNAPAVVKAKKPIYIVEGEIDALSIIEVGGEAIGLGSTSSISRLLPELLDKYKGQIKQPFIIALDNDKAGEEAKEKLKAVLTERELFFLEASFIYGEAKDANEALTTDRKRFTEVVLQMEEQTAKALEAENNEEKEQYLSSSSAGYMANFLADIQSGKGSSFFSTGYKRLDKVLEGGIYEGLTVVGAVSSLGKTTVVVNNIADNFAKNGNDVLIFSLEMSRTELQAKSISRITIEKVLASGQSISNAKTNRGITVYSRYANYNQQEKELIAEAIQEYTSYANKIWIAEASKDFGFNTIREAIEKHKKLTGKAPIVIIDYLQILATIAPSNNRADIRANTDATVWELKALSRDFNIPVIAISSFNRESYSKQVTLTAFKESGGIEYSADTVIGLQFSAVSNNSSGFDENKEKQKNPREIDFCILKNRSGETGKKIPFKFYPMFNYFQEIEE